MTPNHQRPFDWPKACGKTPDDAAHNGKQMPALYQFQDRDGTWHNFMHQEHYENTVKDGSWPIRALYTHPASALPAEGVPAQMPRLNDAMRGVLRNERDVYGSEEEIYAALVLAAQAEVLALKERIVRGEA